MRGVKSDVEMSSEDEMVVDIDIYKSVLTSQRDEWQVQKINLFKIPLPKQLLGLQRYT